MPEPNKEMWLKKSAEFYKFTNFPNCLGSVDGKHVRMQCPPNTGSDYFNFKKCFSIVLMAVADANYYFTPTDGSYGRAGNSYIFKKSNFWKRFTAGQLDLSGDKPLPSDESKEGTPVPHVLLEMRLLACQRICCDHILPKIYLMKRGYTTTGMPEPDALWNVPLEF
jgi:hypothetical protein